MQSSVKELKTLNSFNFPCTSNQDMAIIISLHPPLSHYHNWNSALTKHNVLPNPPPIACKASNSKSQNRTLVFMNRNLSATLLSTESSKTQMQRKNPEQGHIPMHRLGRANNNVVDGDKKKLHKESNKAHHHTAYTCSERNLGKLCKQAPKPIHKQNQMKTQTARSSNKCQRRAETCTTQGLYKHVSNNHKSRSCTLVSFIHSAIKLLQNFELALWVWFCANHFPDRATKPLSVLTVPARLNDFIHLWTTS